MVPGWGNRGGSAGGAEIVLGLIGGQAEPRGSESTGARGHRQSRGVEVGGIAAEKRVVVVSVCTLCVKSRAVGVSIRCFDLSCYSKFGTVVLGSRKYLGSSTTEV